jgi:hypothetical protein
VVTVPLVPVVMVTELPLLVDPAWQSENPGMGKPSTVSGAHCSPPVQSDGWLQSCTPPKHSNWQAPLADGGKPNPIDPQQTSPLEQLSEPVQAMVPAQVEPIGWHCSTGGTPSDRQHTCVLRSQICSPHGSVVELGPVPEVTVVPVLVPLNGLDVKVVVLKGGGVVTVVGLVAEQTP